MRWLFRVTLLRMALVVALVLFFVYSPYNFDARGRRIRVERTERASTPLQFAVVWPRENGHLFVEGAETAVRDLNQRGGVTITDQTGKRVRIPVVMRVYNEFETADGGDVATRVASNPNLSAVIGHSEPDSAIRASITYQDRGLLYLSPAVSDIRLTRHGFWTVVRTIPDDAAISRDMVAFALTQGWKRAAILYVRNLYGTTYDRLLREGMGELHARWLTGTNKVTSLELAFQGYYGEDERSFYLLISALLDRQCDVVFLADSLVGKAGQRALTLINQLREMGVSQPILGSEELHSQTLWDRLGPRANHVYAPTTFDSRLDRIGPIERQFSKEFANRYQALPTMHAHEAYEAVLLLAQAVERAHSKVPLKMSIMFKSTHHWTGLQGVGTYDFSLKGGIQGKKIFMEEMKNGVFVAPTIPESCVVFTNSDGELQKTGGS
jgi:ABC-type branched-subunit amino acid transport system substrate-binding protein